MSDLPHFLTSSLPHSLLLGVRSRRSLRCASLALAVLVMASCGGGGDQPKPTVVEVDVKFDSVVPVGHLPATLCGTLSTPAENAQGLTGVVLLPGTEAFPRSGTVASVALLEQGLDGLDGTLDGRLALSSPVEVFRDLAQFLAERRFAVLRYDNRTWLVQNGSTCAANPGSGPYTTYADDFLSDSVAAVDLLRSRPEVLPGRVFVIGYGEGAALALLQAAVPERVAGAVLLGAAARPLDAVILERMSRRLQYLRGLPSSPALEQAIEAQQAELAGAQDGFARVRAHRFPITDLLLGWGRFYWETWLSISDRTLTTFGAVQGPLLFLQGTQDYEIPGSELGLFGEPGQSGRVMLRTFPVTRALNAVSQSRVEASVSPQVLDFITAWLQAH
jgi:pimeloyl-ACP methyl ester carboxylesterase